MNDIQYYIVKLPQSLQDLISEYNVEHRVNHIKVMKELKTVFKCNFCKNRTINGIYYDKYDLSIIYCSMICQCYRGWFGAAYSN